MPSKTIQNRNSGQRFALSAITLGCLLLGQSLSQNAWAQQAANVGPAQGTLSTVTVISSMPLPALGQTLEELPSAVQSATREQIEQTQALDLSDFMRTRLTGVHVTENQGNPLQGDLSYRGYTASPLLGTPQGMSLYMDGVRLNQPFGDVVSWDLIPRSAIESVTLMPGSNPVFGLNTLGGAIGLQTRDGRSSPGTQVEWRGGSHGRYSVELTHGGKTDSRHWFITSNLWGEQGWRDASRSRVGQLFAKVGAFDRNTDVQLSFAMADTSLTGNGLQESRLLANDYKSVYSKPDITANRSFMLNLTATHKLPDDTLLAGNAWYRRIATNTFNGDVNEDSLDQSVYQPNLAERNALTAAGYSGFPVAGANASNTPFPFWRCIANVLLNDEPAEKCNGLLTRSETKQNHWGFNLQATKLSEGKLQGQSYRNQFVWGGGLDANRTHFKQSTQLGYLNPDRSITGLNAFGDGVTGGVVDGQSYDTRVDLHGRMQTLSVYGANTLSLGERWHISASARFNETRVRNSDQITPGGGAGSLDADYRYRRLNPALGVSHVLSDAFNAYAGYSEGSRTPTATELGCADPNNPCKLPNAMAGDPPLNQVVTKSWEAGLRGRLANKINWSAGLFRSENEDDILFVTSTATGMGYFKNFGRTRRQGLELALETSGPVWAYGMNLTVQSATFQSTETVNGSSNSTNDAVAPGLEGNITVQPGNHIPQIPGRILKAWSSYRFDPQWTGVLSFNAVSGSFARGNENNQHQPDGVYYFGSGRTAGYATVDLAAKYEKDRKTSVLFQVKNLFDRRYSTGAQLGATAFTPNGNFIARPFPAVGTDFPLMHSTFYAPGAPRSIWVGLRYQM